MCMDEEYFDGLPFLFSNNNKKIENTDRIEKNL